MGSGGILSSEERGDSEQDGEDFEYSESSLSKQKVTSGMPDPLPGKRY